MQLLKVENEQHSAEEMNRIPISVLIKKNVFIFHKYTPLMKMDMLRAFISGEVPSTSEGAHKITLRMDKRLYFVELLKTLFLESKIMLVSAIHSTYLLC